MYAANETRLLGLTRRAGQCAVLGLRKAKRALHPRLCCLQAKTGCTAHVLPGHWVTCQTLNMAQLRCQSCTSPSVCSWAFGEKIAHVLPMRLEWRSQETYGHCQVKREQTVALGQHASQAEMLLRARSSLALTMSAVDRERGAAIPQRFGQLHAKNWSPEHNSRSGSWGNSHGRS